MPNDLRARLRELLELAERATPRPWSLDPDWTLELQGAPDEIGMTKRITDFRRSRERDPDAEYIAASANLAPALARFALAVLAGDEYGECWACQRATGAHDDGCPLGELAAELETAND
jgi:hypothetical protein